MENEGESTNQEQEPVATQPFNPPVPENNETPEVSPNPSDNFNTEVPTYQAPDINATVPIQSFNNNMVGLSGSSLDIKPDKSNRTKRIIYILVTIAALLALCTTGFFAYRYFFLPPSNWKMIEDTRGSVSFYFPSPCDENSENDISSNGYYGMVYGCVLKNPSKVYTTLILKGNPNETKSFNKNDEITAMEAMLTNSTKNDEIISKKEVTKNGLPSLEIEVKKKSLGNDVFSKMIITFDKQNNLAVVAESIGKNTASNREINLIINSIQIK